MKVSELIAELQKWPQDSEVDVTPDAGGFVQPIVSVSGAAGASIDGRDSSVCINVRLGNLCDGCFNEVAGE